MTAAVNGFQAGASPSPQRRSIEDEKNSSGSDTAQGSNDNLNAIEVPRDYPSPTVRWMIVVALLLGEFLVSEEST